MKKLIYLLTLIFVSLNLFSQDEKQEVKEPIIKLSGHIRYDAYFDTHESVAARDGDVYLYPTRQVLNADNEDIKNYNSLNMFAYESRLRAKINGPDAMGAKISGLAEIDFEGRANGHENAPRARHLFMNMDWGQTKLLIGQYWHPTFVTECFPEVIVAGAGAPFQPFNRSTQVALTHKLTDNLEVSGAVLSHFDMESVAGSAAQNNAVLPDIHGTLKYKTDNLVTGLIAGYRLLKQLIKKLSRSASASTFTPSGTSAALGTAAEAEIAPALVAGAGEAAGAGAGAAETLAAAYW
jgi:hypothetical protein